MMFERSKSESRTNPGTIGTMMPPAQMPARRGAFALIGLVLIVFTLLGFIPAASAKDSPEDPIAQRRFKANCAVCHGPDGTANTPSGKSMKAPNLRSKGVQKRSDAELAQAIANGKSSMPPFRNILTKEQIQGLVTYIRGLARTD